MKNEIKEYIKIKTVGYPVDVDDSNIAVKVNSDINKDYFIFCKKSDKERLNIILNSRTPYTLKTYRKSFQCIREVINCDIAIELVDQRNKNTYEKLISKFDEVLKSLLRLI